MLKYFNKEHEKNFMRLMWKDIGNLEKKKTKAKVIYLLSASDRLVKIIDDLIEIEPFYIKPENLERLNLSNGETMLVAIAYNLYNGYNVPNVKLTPYNIKQVLDESLYNVYLKTLLM